jgi:hypothetical protein
VQLVSVVVLSYCIYQNHLIACLLLSTVHWFNKNRMLLQDLISVLICTTTWYASATIQTATCIQHPIPCLNQQKLVFTCLTFSHCRTNWKITLSSPAPTYSICHTEQIWNSVWRRLHLPVGGIQVFGQLGLSPDNTGLAVNHSGIIIAAVSGVRLSNIPSTYHWYCYGLPSSFEVAWQ